MAESRERLTGAERESIYQEEIRPLHLAGIGRSTAPTVIFVGGAPGSGKTGTVPPVAAELEKRSGIPLVVSIDDLREHHPFWRRDARTDAHAAERFDVDASDWFNRLYRDAIAERANVVLVTWFKDPQLLTDTVTEFRAAGYRAEAVILAVNEQRTRRSVMGRYLHAQQTGQLPRWVTATSHHEGYAGLRRTVQKAESARLVDQIQVVRRDGTMIYSNHLINGQWQKERGAVDAVDTERDRPLTPAEKADNAIAWHQLTVRAQRNKATPEDVMHQALMWRKDASQRALADPEAAKQYGWKLASEAFTTMPRERFLREFPAYAGAVERMDKAVEHAKTHYAIEDNQTQFIAGVRTRLAQQIEEGRQFGRIKQSDRDLHASVAKTIDEGRSR